MNTILIFKKLIGFITITFCLLSLNSALAQATNKTWTAGAGTSDWNTAANWSPSGVPTATDIVQINVTSGLYPEITTTDAIVKALIVSSNTSLNIALNSQLTVSNGVVTVNFRYAVINNGTINNNGKLLINGGIDVGLNNDGTIKNYTGAEITIGSVNSVGILLNTVNALLENFGQIFLEENTCNSTYYIRVNGGNFNNTSCGIIKSLSTCAIKTETGATFSNAGLLIVSNPPPSSNSFISTITSNTGIIQDLNDGGFSFQQPSTSTINSLGIAPSNCPTLDNGSIMVFNLGANTEYVVTLGTNGTPQTLTSSSNGQLIIGGNLSLGTYTLTIKKNCWPQTVNMNVTVSEAKLISVINSRSASCTLLGAIVFSTNMDFIAPLITYPVTYKRNGVSQTGTASVYSQGGGNFCSIENLGEGNYSDFKVNYGTCEAPFSGTIYLSGGTSASTITNATTCAGTNGSILFTTSANVGTYTLTYKKNGNTQSTNITVTGTRGRVFTLSNLSSGIYTDFTFTTANCTVMYSPIIRLGDLPNPSISNTFPVTTFGGADGSILITGLAVNKTYSISFQRNEGTTQNISATSNSDGNLTISNIASGNYTNIIISINNCSSASLSTIVDSPQPTTLSAVPNQTICEGKTINNIMFTLGGDIDATLSASSSNPALTPTYTFEGTGANRSLIITTITGQSGTSIITLTAVGLIGGIATSSFELTINPNPMAPVTSAQSFCGEATIANLIASGLDIKWYNTATSEVALASTAILTTGSYYASQTVNVCESIRIETDVTINTLPNVVASNSGPYEIASTIQLNTSEGATYSWTGPNGFSSTQQNPSIFNAQSYRGGIYTISLTNQAGCVGVATTLVTINTSDPCIQILKYSYVLSGNPHQYLFALTNGMSISKSNQPTAIIVSPTCINIPIESVEMQFSNGTTTWKTLQNIQPYAIFDNEGTFIRGQVLSSGTYTLTVAGYAQDNKMGGVVYGPVVTTFTIIEDAPIISLSTTNKTEFCAGSTFEVGFTTTGNFSNGNLFKVILSDKDGKFDNFQVIGTNNSISNISCTIPQNIEYGENYKLRIISTSPSVAEISNSTSFTIHPKDLSLISPQNDFPFGKKVRKATETITATNNHTGDAKITYQAGKSIMLLPGFNVSNISPVFQAEIQTCE